MTRNQKHRLSLGAGHALRVRRAAIATLVPLAILLSALPSHAARVAPSTHSPTRGGLTSSPGGDPGHPVICIDVRTGTPFEYHAQHLFSSGALDTAWIPDSTRICLGSPEGGPQRIVAAQDGGAFVAWVSRRAEYPDIALQRFSVAGAIATGWPADGLPVCAAPYSQYQLDACADGSGGAFLTWQDFRSDHGSSVYVQRIGANGTPASGWPSEGIPVSSGTSEQTMPQVASDGSGGALVTWCDRRSGRLEVFAQHVTATGGIASGWPASGALVVPGGTHAQATALQTLGDGHGRVLIIWRTEDDSLGVALSAVWLSTASVPSPEALTATTLTSSAQSVGDASLSAVPDGSTLVVWSEHRAGQVSLRATRLANTGTRVNGWVSGGNPVALSEVGASAAAVLGDGQGGALITWEDHRQPSGGDIYAARLNADGTLDSSWPDDGLIVCTALGDQFAPSISPDGNGGAVVTWIDAATQAVAGYLSLKPTGAGAPHLLATIVDPGHVRVTWEVDPSSARYTAERRVADGAWQTLGDLAPDDSAHVTLDDAAAPEREEIDYRLSMVRGSSQVLSDLVHISVPGAPEVLALERVWPVGNRDAIAIGFALPHGPEAHVELIDIAGRRRVSQSLGMFGAGHHVIEISSPERLSSGVYFVRLSQGSQLSTRKVVFVR